jgi:hypothetical protein
MNGPDVRELHDRLEMLDLLVPSVERKCALFGPGTKLAVMKLQRAHFSSSRVTGILDQATANLISSGVGRDD